jgi:hypothetical protein
MSKSNNTSTSGGAGFLSILIVLFIGLKLTGFITWSWWWVLSPILLPFMVLIVVLTIWALLEIKG